MAGSSLDGGPALSISGSISIDGHAQRRSAKPAKWVSAIARGGLIAKGFVYLVIASLMLQAAVGHGMSPPPDRADALRSILRQPFGRLLLGAVAAGLFAYALWRVLQAVFNPEREASDTKGWGRRLMRLGSGILYGSLGIAALRLCIGFGGRHDPSDWTTWVLRQPLGRWLVGATGIAVAGYGTMLVVQSMRSRLKEKLDLSRLRPWARRLILLLGALGRTARGVVFVIMGWFLLTAAVRFNPSEAKGLAGALAAVQRAPYGPALLALVAAGFGAYGLYQLVEARYRRIREVDMAAAADAIKPP
jgi:hypothetical protein